MKPEIILTIITLILNVVFTVVAILIASARNNAKMETRMDQLDRDVQRVIKHVDDPSRHLDQRSWEELMRRMEGMERKIEEGLVRITNLVIPTTTKKD